MGAAATGKTTAAIGDSVAEQVRRHRLLAGLTVRQLAQECARLGAPELTPASLTNIERPHGDGAQRGRRKVTAAEIVILAEALQVSPVALLKPARVRAQLRQETYARLAQSTRDLCGIIEELGQGVAELGQDLAQL